MGLRELMLVGSVAIPICPPPKPRGSHVQEECVSKIDCPDDSCGLQNTCKLPGSARASGMLRLLPDCMEGTEFADVQAYRICRRVQLHTLKLR